ncbi:MAG: thiamine-phosphate kinase [Planctomycetes bacterium]|nr:thiamine-phosphate kinase [Planctomycetota bacterium]NBY01887.1 thiamine-phosphate kinase [Planctomycetota bacterium]
MGDKSELEFVSWLRTKISSKAWVPVGPGDDAAVVQWPNDKPCLATSDMLLEGSCFILAEAGAERIGRKAMNVNLSDIAAMAGIPRAALVSLALPKNGGKQLAQQLFKGLNQAAELFDTAIVGGDTNAWNGPLAISITLLGFPGPKGPILRSNAKPGDAILVTGQLGGSILGKHLDFTPRIAEAQLLSQLTNLNSMIDLSDGLALDLHRLCTESKCGATLFADRIPISEAALQMKDDKTPLQHALGDGEDFELLFTLPALEAQQLLKDQPLKGLRITQIGEITKDGLFMEEKGRKFLLEALGYIHQFD